MDGRSSSLDSRARVAATRARSRQFSIRSTRSSVRPRPASLHAAGRHAGGPGHVERAPHLTGEDDGPAHPGADAQLSHEGGDGAADDVEVLDGDGPPRLQHLPEDPATVDRAAMPDRDRGAVPSDQAATTSASPGCALAGAMTGWRRAAQQLPRSPRRRPRIARARVRRAWQRVAARRALERVPPTAASLKQPACGDPTAGSLAGEAACERSKAPIRSAMYLASSLTQPSSAEPRVCCHGRPRKYRPGTSVTPRSWMTSPRSSKTGNSTSEWSSRKPVAHTTASTVTSEPSAKRTLLSCAATARGRSWMPCRRARRGVDPIRVSRSFIR